MLQRINAHYVNGQWRTIAAPDWHTLVNPADGEAYACVARADAGLVNDAVSAASHAFPAWSALSFSQRAEYLAAFIQQLQQRRDELVEAVVSELGAPLWFAREVHVDDPLDAFAKHLDYAKVLQNEQLQLDARLKLRKEAVGVCALITPWNYPLHQIIAKLAPALLAGCTVVLKPAELTPKTALCVAMAADAAGLPPGVFNLVLGSGSQIGDILSTHADIDCVSFTGSTEIGRHIQQQAAATVKRVCLELGGKSAFLISPTEQLSAAVKLGVEDVMANSGQTCTALSRMLVHHSQYAEAVAIAAAHANSLTVGEPHQDGVFLGPLISAAQYQSVQRYIDIGLTEGAELVAGGAEPVAGLGAGYYLRPTVFANVHNQMQIAREEIFGPVLCILPYQDEADALRIANDSPYGLSGRVWADDAATAQQLAAGIRAGLIFINAAPWHNAAPFGGYKQSGNGRELGLKGVEEYLELKAIVDEGAA